MSKFFCDYDKNKIIFLKLLWYCAIIDKQLRCKIWLWNESDINPIPNGAAENAEKII